MSSISIEGIKRYIIQKKIQLQYEFKNIDFSNPEMQEKMWFFLSACLVLHLSHNFIKNITGESTDPDTLDLLYSNISILFACFWRMDRIMKLNKFEDVLDQVPIGILAAVGSLILKVILEYMQESSNVSIHGHSRHTVSVIGGFVLCLIARLTYNKYKKIVDYFYLDSNQFKHKYSNKKQCGNFYYTTDEDDTPVETYKSYEILLGNFCGLDYLITLFLLNSKNTLLDKIKIRKILLYANMGVGLVTFGDWFSSNILNDNDSNTFRT